MTFLAHLLADGARVTGLTALVYALTVAVVALTAALARTPRRRADARKTLAVLVRRRPRATARRRR
jgi:hypothetical protein